RYQKQKKTCKRQADDDWFPQLRTETVSQNPVEIDKDGFERDCLTEYAEVFKTVSFDGAYYRFPTRQSLEKLAAQVPTDFQFGFKVTCDVTVKKCTRDKRYGNRAGKPNEHFLNADLFANAFLLPCESIRRNV